MRYVTVEITLGELEKAAPLLKDLNIFLKLEILSEFRDRVIQKIRRIIPHAVFKRSTGKLIQSIYGLVLGERVVFYSLVDYFGPQEYGVKPHTMWYLLNKTIPLRKDIFEKPIFRKCTLRSVLRGSWRHPGYPGKYFVHTIIQETVREELEEIVKNKIYKIIGVPAFD